MPAKLIIDVATLVVAIVGVVLAVVQLMKHTRVTASQHLFAMLKEFYADAIRSSFSDYIDRFKDGDAPYYLGMNGLGEPKFKDDETEKSIDRMLLLFERLMCIRCQ